MCVAMRVYTGKFLTQKTVKTYYLHQIHYSGHTDTHTHTYSSMKLSNYNSEHKKTLTAKYMGTQQSCAV